MQPFTGIDSSSDQVGEPGSSRPVARGNQNDVSYRERPFSDLVDEDKHALVGRKFAASLLGGYRMVLNDYEEDTLPVMLHLAQLLIYLILPAAVIISSLIVPDDRWVAMCIAGSLSLLVSSVIMIISLALRGKNQEESESDSVSCFSRRAFLFLFPPKQSVREIILAAFLALVNGALMVYMIHPKTNGDDLVARIPHLIIMGLSSYSLFSGHCPELAIYRDNDSELAWGSNHYQRSTYLSLISLILLITIEQGYATATSTLWLNHSFLIVYFLQVFGMLSHPVVTILWAMEQISVHLYGGTPRASDSRIALSFVVQSLFVAVPLLLLSQSQTNVAKILMVLLAFLSSNNMLCSLGIIQPFKKVNERMQKMNNYADIVFRSADGQQPAAVFSSTQRNAGGSGPIALFLYFTRTVILAGILAFLAIVIENPEKDMKLPRTLIIVTVALTVVMYLLSMASRHTVFRVIPCLHLQQGLAILKYLGGMLKILLPLGLCISYLMIIDSTGSLKRLQLAAENDLVTIGEVLEMTFIFRMFARAFHDPFGASIESLALLKYDQAWHLCLFAFILHRARVLFNKTVYIFVSVVTAIKNKKQRFSNQCLCFALQFTLGLPITLFVLLLSTLLDTALIPFLGFAFFTIGYPKPQRGWSAINPASANLSDARSDGHLYQALLPELTLQVQKMVSEDPFSFQRDRFYLLKNEKMIVLIQVLERGHNFLYFSAKGAELQETTVCHAEENGRMNDEVEQLFERKQRNANVAFSLSPMKQISFDVYDDQKVSLSGVIESPDFEELVKKAFMYIVFVKLKDNFTSRLAERPQLFRVYKAELQERELAPGRTLLDHSWLSHLGFDYSAIEFRQIPAPTTSSAMNFKNQVQPASAMSQRSGAGSGKDASQQEPLTFLQRLEAENRLEGSGLPPPRARPRQLPALQTAQQPTNAQNRPSGGNGVAAAAVPVSQSVVPGALPPGSTGSAARHQLPSIKKGTGRQGPTDDLDELEDMLENLEGGGLDDLDDLLDDLGVDGGRGKVPKPPGVKSAGTVLHQGGGTGKRIPGKAENLEGTFSEGLTRGPNPSSGSGLGEATSLPQLGGDESRVAVGAPPSRSDNQRMTQERPRSPNRSGSKDIEKFAVEAFHLLFGDQYQTTPLKIQAIFRGQLKKTFDNRDFLDSQVQDALHLKHIILRSARLAFHWALESFIMGEMDVPADHEAFESELREMDREWFLGSEEYLWNTAIERHLPKLERLISKDGQHYAHRLILGQGKESTFSVFQFRREVIRGIWANQNVELLYYTNANDERFSIQAEKDILRNLLIQLAEIPLGYPVFSSGAQQAVDWPLESRNSAKRWSC